VNFNASGSAAGRGTTFQMTAMVDVVFILLSFFVLATQFRVPERDVDLDYRASQLAAGARREDFPAFIALRLERSANGVALRVGQAQLADNDYAAVTAKLAEIGLPDIGVLIQAEPALTVGEVARALDAVLASPMRKVSVSSLAVAAARGPGSPASRPGVDERR